MVPHVPQLLVSVCRLVQVLLHSFGLLDGHWQLPPRHCLPPVQVFPQAPQWVLLACKSTHWLLQLVCEGGHAVWHIWATQMVPFGQAFPQEPQLPWLVLRLTQIPPHAKVKGGHSQVPKLQRFPPVQILPHVPQFCGSFCRSTQAPLHSVWVPGQVSTQLPLMQSSLCWHALGAIVVLHAPQWLRLVWVSTQMPLQLVCPIGQAHEPASQNVPPIHWVPHAPQ